MNIIRPVVGFVICLLVSLAVLDIGMVAPDFVAGNAGGDWRQLMGAMALVDTVAAPVVAFGGFLGGFFVLSGNRENGNSSRLNWMVTLGALAGAIYGALAFLLISRSAVAFAIGAATGAVAGVLSGAIWCIMVERPRHA